MKLAVIGKTGQLASALAGHAPDAVFYNREDLDLSAEPEVIAGFIRNIPKADVLIIAAAYTDVDKAEAEPELAFNINARAPGVIARECAKRNIAVIYVSTDCVFDGRQDRAYAPEDAANPINFYGVSKLEGERGVENANPKSAILRTSWVFNGTHSNFMTKMLGLAQRHKSLRIVADQIGRPTPAKDLAQACLTVARALANDDPKANGIFHNAGGGVPVSRAVFARAIFKQMGLSPSITDIPTTNFPTPAQRPLNSVLDISRFEQTFDHVMPDWKDGLALAAKEFNHEA